MSVEKSESPFYTKSDRGLVISDEALAWSLISARFVLEQGLVNDASAFAGVFRQLVKNKFIEKDEVSDDWVVKQSFTIVKLESTTWLGVHYPKQEIPYEAGRAISSFQMCKDMKEKAIPDYDYVDPESTEEE